MTPPGVTVPAARRLLVAAGAAVGLGVIGGLAWWWLASPARWRSTGSSLTMSEAATAARFGVVGVFVAVGAFVSFVWAVAATWLLRPVTWRLVPLVVVSTGLASLLAWRLGVLLGPPDPRGVTGLADGDTVPARLAVDAVAPFLVWPIFGLVGLLITAWMMSDPDTEPSELEGTHGEQI